MLRRTEQACLTLLLALALSLLATSSTLAQESSTPTPDAEGIIYIEVQPNDSYWSIAARAGLTLQELLDLNGLTENDVLRPGQRLIVGRGTPAATPTLPPELLTPTPTLPPPTLPPTAVLQRTAICLSAFEDVNQNGVRDGTEPLRAGVAFTVYNEAAVVANYITDGVSEPHCLEGMQAGTYFVTRSVARDEVLTTQGDWALTLTAGTVLNQAFGSVTQQAVETAVSTTPTPAGGLLPGDNTSNGRRSLILLLAIAVFVLLMSAAVLIFWIGLRRRRAQSIPPPQ